MGILKTAFRSYWRVKLFTLFQLGILGRPYHPTPFTGRVRIRSHRVRGTLERWRAIESFLVGRKPSSILDIGCHTGFFSLALAKQGHVCLGVDINKRALYAAELIKKIDGADQASFMHFPISLESISRLPTFDITICLSVFHHWASQFGTDEAMAIMRSVAEHTKDLLFFETAQTNNCSDKYRKVLPAMGKNPRVWLEGFLTDLGFSKVSSIGAFSVGGAGRATRELMVGVREGDTNSTASES